ncbi:hypothetical protein [Pseudobacillus badius]|uniref:hypothetical protein n=1 Tax=Bacillus badius TaxID=1455 RepID=UPI0007B0734E|nr:hypothetical protein [Bacillus badius]KZO01098.1 hypothetical protein A4244_13810 [Bacillus badius]KZR59521.1 hypothetical protein A3781_12155 [Bacillus badius]OCS89149.1 hypothetical protein A6M11_13830 [Bacillus badius]OVE50913.1 transposase [Bacillus badius]TDW01631.1 hypothetical protein B0G66_11079 [Bacillus badius]
MLSKLNSSQREQLEMIALDQLVPQNHLVRKMETTIDFSFIYDLVEELYSEVGRPSTDPVILIKLTFIQYTFGRNMWRKPTIFAITKRSNLSM